MREVLFGTNLDTDHGVREVLFGTEKIKLVRLSRADWTRVTKKFLDKFAQEEGGFDDTIHPS